MANANLEIWSRLEKTDPDQTKSFQRGGGFKGTAVKPIYTTQKMTEEFGPCGIGWGFTEPQFQVVAGDNKEVLVYCWLSLWIVKDGTKSGLIPGVGGDKVVSYVKPNEQYKRPERWENDDEAFKKAFTDAIGNAMKHLGMSADVHMGRFDDNKYVAQRRREEAEQDEQEEAAPRGQSITAKQRSDANGLIEHIKLCNSWADIDHLKKQPAFVGAYKALPESLQKEVGTSITDRREALAPSEPNLMAG